MKYSGMSVRLQVVDTSWAVRHLEQEMTFYYIAGCGKSAGLTLRLRRIDFSAGRLTLDPGKTENDEGRIFPFTQELRDLLKAQRAVTDQLQYEKGIVCPGVFHRNDRQIKSCDGAWRSACKKCWIARTYSP